MLNQVGSPAMFEGKRFFPLTGTPIPKMLFSSTLLADCEPDPFTVATLMLKSLVTRLRALIAPCSWPRARSPVAIWRDSLPKNSGKRLSFFLRCDYSHLRGPASGFRRGGYWSESQGKNAAPANSGTGPFWA